MQTKLLGPDAGQFGVALRGLQQDLVALPLQLRQLLLGQSDLRDGAGVRVEASVDAAKALEEALGLYKEALGILVSAYGYADARVGALLHNMAGVYVRMEDWGEAQRCYEEAVDVKRRVHGAGHRDVELSERHLEKVKAKANVKGKVKFKRREKEECDGG